jgi:hypothetical protein
MFMRKVLAVCIIAVSSVAPAMAAPLDVTFTGLVTDTCTIAIPTPGIMMMSSDGKMLGSDQALGVPATLTVISLGTNHIDLATPALTGTPPGYAGGETLQMNTTGLFNHPVFTSLGINFDIGILSITSLIVNMHVTNPAGFTQGMYTAKSVLTCS